jgi:hypothetical protein
VGGIERNRRIEMERENVEKYLKENLKGVRVETKRIIMGGLDILEPVIFLELKDDSEIRFFRLNLNLEKWED